jgi:hypothetical protein
VTAASGTNPVKWALVSASYVINEFDEPEATTLAASSSKNLSAWTPTELSQASISTAWNSAGPWTFQQSGQRPGGPTDLIPASNALSYTEVFGTSGTMNGAFPLSTDGLFGSTLAVLQGGYGAPGNTMIQLGTASLSADGLTLMLAGAPVVPIPAAVILFGTGLVGLVGVARRKTIAA